MRITNVMMTNRLITNVNKNLTDVDNYYLQMSSGKKIQMPSDDPIVASRALKFRTIVSETEQYTSNTKQATSWLEITESAFNNTESILQTMRELCVSAATDSKTTDDRMKILTEYNSLLEQVESEMNSTYMGRYVFSGYKTDEKLVIQDEDGVNILNPAIYGNNGESNLIDGQSINIEVGVNNYIGINTLGTNVYDKDTYDTLHSFDDEYQKYQRGGVFTAEDETQLRSDFDAMLGKIDDIMANLSKEQTEVGVKASRLALVNNRLGEDNVNYTNLMSNNEDVNLAEAAMNWNVANATYTAALKVGMSITQLTLVDYL